MLWSAALPAYAVGVEQIQICSSHGDRTLFVASDPGASGEAEACQHCGHCTLAAPGLLPEASAFTAAVRYAAVADSTARSVSTAPKSARAPPRPPSQAPPFRSIA